MKKRLFTLLLALALLASLIPQTALPVRAADAVAINASNFPDANFRSKISSNFDKNSDGSLSKDEISQATSLYVGYSSITSLQGIKFLTGLKTLSCNGNKLTTLDVSKNPALESLSCADNQLTELKLDINTSLKELRCDYNPLADLVVKRNTALETLTCDKTQLTELDLSNNKKLIRLSCEDNQLTSLDLRQNTALERLDIYKNQFTALNLTNNKKLTELYCDYNEIKELKVSGNTALVSLSCSNNPLTKLDVSKNTKLETLDCGGTKLTSLDVSANKALKSLGCHSTKITSLNLSNNPNLESLTCYSNGMTKLDVSKNPALKSLYCSDNKLTALNLSNNKNLVYLYCGSNKLSTLDLSNRASLKDVDCKGNALTTLKVNGCPELLYLYCQNNKLTKLDLTGDQNLKQLYCYGNQISKLDVSASAMLVDALKNGQRRTTDNYVAYETTKSYIYMDRGQKTNPEPPHVYAMVTWKVGSSSRTTDVLIGTVPVYEYGTPWKSYTTTSHYTFTGWKSGKTTYKPANLPKVNDDITFTAVFKAVNHSFTSRITRKPTATRDGERTYKCSCGYTYTEAIPATNRANPFTDVNKKDYFYDPVMWAVYHDPQVTAGTSKTKFSPNATCTREQVVTFLWRAAGCPTPKTKTCPFKDVKKGDYYEKAVLWAVEKGITQGTSSTKFGVGQPCTRGQVVTFLCRAKGSPAPKTSKNPFKDVSKKDYYYSAVLWAVEKGITAGTSKTKFSPNDTCTRGQIVTFLYRAYK